MSNHNQLLTPEEKHRMIAKAAYFRAEKEGFTGRDPMKDWFAAEAEIEKSLKLYRQAKLRNNESAAYDRLRLEIKKVNSGLEAFSEKSAQLLVAWKDRGSNFLTQVSKVANERMSRYRKKNG